MKYNTFFKLSVTVMLIAFFSNATAQRIYDTTTVNIMNEIGVAQAYYYQTGYLSFDAEYRMTDNDTVTVRDTVYFKYKMNGDSMYILKTPDTMEMIQNKDYVATLSRPDSIIMVQKPSPFIKPVFQVDVNDSVFQQLSMSSMTVTDSGCNRRVIINFDTNSIYKNFKMVYCKNTYQLAYITYTLKKEPTASCTKTVDMYIRYTNYQTGQFGASVFSTDPYIKVNSVSDIQLAPGMSASYEIVNLLEH
jgi:hypothetical protein